VPGFHQRQIVRIVVDRLIASLRMSATNRNERERIRRLLTNVSRSRRFIRVRRVLPEAECRRVSPRFFVHQAGHVSCSNAARATKVNTANAGSLF
jgi:hypothetical protein